MKLLLVSESLKEFGTVGKLFDGAVELAATLEDQYRPGQEKVPGETCIPAGTYALKWTYSPRFRRNMIQVMDVPGFDGVRVHAGNGIDDTSGCILVGERLHKYRGQWKLFKSRATVKKIEDLVFNKVNKGEIVELEIRR